MTYAFLVHLGVVIFSSSFFFVYTSLITREISLETFQLLLLLKERFCKEKKVEEDKISEAIDTMKFVLLMNDVMNKSRLFRIYFNTFFSTILIDSTGLCVCVRL